MPVAQALRLGDLDEARRRVGYLVSRRTSELDACGVARAGTESVLENGADAVFASLFWFAVLGAPGVLLHRLSNTLDAMWGYRNERFERFGWAAAKIDDVLNYVPARLVALTYALLGRTATALRCWRSQAPQWDSPNAGPVMAAGAGALQVQLGGSAIYHGVEEQRPQLGEGAPAQARDIERALNLVYLGVLLWLVGLAIWGVVPCLSMAGGCARRRSAMALPWRTGSTCPPASRPMAGRCRRSRPTPGSACRSRTMAWKRWPAITTAPPRCCRWPARRRRSRPCRACAAPACASAWCRRPMPSTHWPGAARGIWYRS